MVTHQLQVEHRIGRVSWSKTDVLPLYHATNQASTQLDVMHVVVGRVPGDYPVPAGYCTTRHYPDPARYYVKMWPDPSNLSSEQLDLVSAMATGSVICVAVT